MSRRRALVMDKDSKLTISRRCQLLEISRSACYYRSRSISQYTLELMKEMDAMYDRSPDRGTRKIRDQLRNQGRQVNRKRIQRLMQVKCIQAI